MWGRFLRGTTRGSLGTNHLSASTSEMLCTPNSKAESSRWPSARVEDTDAAQRQKETAAPTPRAAASKMGGFKSSTSGICIRAAIGSKQNNDQRITQNNSQNHNEMLVCKLSGVPTLFWRNAPRKYVPLTLSFFATKGSEVLP